MNNKRYKEMRMNKMIKKTNEWRKIAQIEYNSSFNSEDDAIKLCKKIELQGFCDKELAEEMANLELAYTIGYLNGRDDTI